MSDSEILWPWSELGMKSQPEDPRDIRRAYARRLKEIDQATDIAGFETLRRAYEHALRMAETPKPQRRVTPVSGSRIENVLLPSDPQTEAMPVSETAQYDDKFDTKSASPQEPAEIKTEIPGNDLSETKPTPNPWSRKDYSDPDTVFKDAQKLIGEKSMNSASWLPLIESGALTDPQASDRFQRMLVDYLSEGNPSSFAREGLYIAAEERFGWTSDGVTFLRRFPYARKLYETMSEVLRGHRRSQERHEAANSARQDQIRHGKPIPMIMWVFPFLFWVTSCSVILG